MTNKIHTVAELEAMSSKELVALFNEHSRKPVTKFADRATAVKRTYDMLPSSVAETNVKVVRVSKKPATPSVAPVVKAEKQAKAAPKAKAEKKPAADRSAAIAASWTDPVIAAKRAERTHVKASGTLYRSVREAFEALELPLTKHIKFRMELKAVHELTFKHEGRQVKFSVVASE